MSDREFENSFPEYNPSKPIFNFETGRLSCDVEGVVLKSVFSLLDVLEKSLPVEANFSDPSVYTGTAGIALMYMHFTDFEQCKGRRDYIRTALHYIEPVLPKLKHKHPSFLCGSTGPLAVGAALYHRQGNEGEKYSLAESVDSHRADVCSCMKQCPDELLYGRAGYLYSLLFLQKYTTNQTDPTKEHDFSVKDRVHSIKQVVNVILESGKNGALKLKNTKQLPLFYEWHDKAYVGAAHGFVGILYMLLQAHEYLSKEQIDEYIRPMIDHILDLQFPSGNFPSSFENPNDRLVQWCHGAPGAIHLFLLAYQLFGEEKYLKVSKVCSDVIWQRGILKKGYGLCHGVAGNGYGHLRLFQVTKDQLYLYRALKFAEFCFDYGKHGCRTADRPLSLYEGLSGTIYYLLDLLKPLDSAFPGFQLC